MKRDMKQDPDKHARREKESCKPAGEGKEISFQLWIYTHTDTVYQLAYSLFGLTLINPVMGFSGGAKHVKDVDRCEDVWTM